LTYSGQLTHISGHPSATGRAQDRESSPAKDRCSTTVPRNQPVTLSLHTQHVTTSASYALVAVRYELQSQQLLSSTYLFICLLFAHPKSKFDFRSAILNPLKISYLFILLNFC